MRRVTFSGVALVAQRDRIADQVNHQIIWSRLITLSNVVMVPIWRRGT